MSLLFIRNHLGSVRELVTSSDFTMHARYDFDPYGQRTKLDGELDCDFGFTGHYEHTPSGLTLAPFRAYYSILGRWVSRDPIAEAGGLNLYGYVGNRPANAADRLGLEDGAIRLLGDMWDNAKLVLGAVGELGQLVDEAFKDVTGQPIEALGPMGAEYSQAARSLSYLGRMSRFAKCAEATKMTPPRVLIAAGKQGKHIPGHNNFIPGRSPLTHNNPQSLLDSFAGKGQPVGSVPRGSPGFKERVDFGQVIGEINGQPTTKGIIHYANDGAHIVPANP